MGYRKCFIPGCKSSSKSTKLFAMPRSQCKFETWMKIIVSKYPELQNIQHRKDLRICKLHFEAKYMLPHSLRVEQAIPTLFTANEISSRIPDNKYTIVWDTCKNDYNLINSRKRVHLSADEHSIYSTYHDHGYFQSKIPKILPITQTTNPGDINMSYDYSNCAPKRPRNVKTVRRLTPKCSKLYQKCLKILKSKRRLSSNFHVRLKKAQALTMHNSFDNMLLQLPHTTKNFINMQLNAMNKHLKQWHFTNDEKMLSLMLLKHSPKGYKLLQKLFILPSRRMLSKFTEQYHMAPGLNPNILLQLKDSVQDWDAKQRAGTIVFDEMSLYPHLTSVESTENVIGLVNFRRGSEKRKCDHNLVFMVRGIVGSWRQLVAFYFCKGTTPAVTLKNILKDIVVAIKEIGLNPMAIVCDQGKTFRTCLRSFQADTRREILCGDIAEGHKINICGHKLNIIYDPPHLLKDIRNNWLTKDLSFCGKIARWADIVEVYNTDCQLGDLRLLRKITNDDIQPTTSQRKKVKTCNKVLSRRMGAMLDYTSSFESHSDGTPVSKTMKNTADAVLFFDRLFESVNSSLWAAADAGKIRGPVKDTRDGNKHVSFWKEATGILEKSYFIETTSSGQHTIKSVPSLNNWIVTLKSVIEIWSDLKKIGVGQFNVIPNHNCFYCQ